VNVKFLWRVAVICGLCLALSTDAKADSLKTTGVLIVVVIVALPAAAVVLTVLAINQAKHRTITGCVNSGENGMFVTNEKDKHVYALSGNTAGVKPGERVTLMGKKITSSAGTTVAWETKKVSRDFGACQP
jgi:hypothetical protein